MNKMNQEYNNNMNPANSTEDNSNTLIDEFGNKTLKYVSYCYSLFSFKSRLRLRWRAHHRRWRWQFLRKPRRAITITVAATLAASMDREAKKSVNGRTNEQIEWTVYSTVISWVITEVEIIISYSFESCSCFIVVCKQQAEFILEY